MFSSRPSVPESIKRQLRQEAAFGCCKCGLPIYQYQHIIPYSQDAHFRPEDMMLLCPTCHYEATLGAMPEAEQRSYKSRPYNVVRGFAAGQLKMNQNICAIAVGTNQFVGDACIVNIDNEPLLSLNLSPEGRLEVSVALYDQSDDLLALIAKNEWISGDPIPWDIESSFQYLCIRRKVGHISLEISAKTEPVRLRADLWRKKQNIRLSPDAIYLKGSLVNVSMRDLCFVGCQLGINPTTAAAEFRVDPRYKAMMWVSDQDPLERLIKGYAAWQNLERA